MPHFPNRVPRLHVTPQKEGLALSRRMLGPEARDSLSVLLFQDNSVGLTGITMETSAEMNDFLLSAIGAVPYGILAIDARGAIIMANEQARLLLDVREPAGEMTEKKIFRYTKTIPELSKRIRESLAAGHSAFDLEQVPFGNRFLSVRGRGILNGIMITIQDITEMKRMEADSLSALLAGQEQERMRIAREIHDGCGPLLSTARLQVEAIAADISDDTKTYDSRFQEVYAIIDNVAAELRNLSHALMPRTLEDFGLVAALENMCARLNATGKVRVVFIHSGIRNRLDREVELNLYRIAQELISNAIRHGQAATINVQLLRHSDSLILMVEDDGGGFDPREAAQSDGVGLANVENRARALSGTFAIDSVPGKGATATIEIPL